MKPLWEEEPSQDDLAAAASYLWLCGERLAEPYQIDYDRDLRFRMIRPPANVFTRVIVEVVHIPTGLSARGVSAEGEKAAEAEAFRLLLVKLPTRPPWDGPHLRKAKDILRAARLPLLPRKNPNVRKHLDKWQAEEKTRPVLLRVREGADARPLEIADGYHRVCAAYWVDENSEVRCFTL